MAPPDVDGSTSCNGACSGADLMDGILIEWFNFHIACALHNGHFTTIGGAYNAIGKWITDNGYRITGPCREVYLKPARNGSQTDPETEIQFPVEKGQRLDEESTTGRGLSCCSFNPRKRTRRPSPVPGQFPRVRATSLVGSAGCSRAKRHYPPPGWRSCPSAADRTFWRC